MYDVTDTITHIQKSSYPQKYKKSQKYYAIFGKIKRKTEFAVKQNE